jgi:hypothetical protein
LLAFGLGRAFFVFGGLVVVALRDGYGEFGMEFESADPSSVHLTQGFNSLAKEQTFV